MKHFTLFFILLLLALVSITCEESLPVYTVPGNGIAMKVSLVEQLSDRIALPGQQKVRIQIEGENIYEEVFQDSVKMQGVVRIWWKRKPYRYRTIYLTENDLTDHNLVENGKMLLLPGQKFAFQFIWDVKADNGYYLPGEMDFTRLTQRLCSSNVACANPEEMVLESSFVIFNKLGTIVVPTKEFTFIGRICVDCGIPPCPPPPGGCG